MTDQTQPHYCKTHNRARHSLILDTYSSIAAALLGLAAMITMGYDQLPQYAPHLFLTGIALTSVGFIGVNSTNRRHRVFLKDHQSCSECTCTHKGSLTRTKRSRRVANRVPARILMWSV